MKKIVLVLAVLLLTGTTMNAQGFLSKLKMGVKAEGNYSGFIFSDLDNAKSTMGAGANVGTFIRLNLSSHFAIQEDIMFTYATSEIEQGGVKDTYQYIGSEIPIYLMGQWNTPGGRIYGGVGPYFGFGFSAKFKDSDINLYKKYDGNDAFMKRLSHGLAAQIGFEFKNGLQINASYKVGMNALDANKDDYKMMPHSATLGIGYSF